MARYGSSDAPDQRTTEVVAVRELGARWVELSSGDFEAVSDEAASEDETVPGRLLPASIEVYRIVIGRPDTPVSDEDALQELVDVLDGALDEEHPRAPQRKQSRRSTRWIISLFVVGAAAAVPHDLLLSVANQALEWIAASIQTLVG